MEFQQSVNNSLPIERTYSITADNAFAQQKYIEKKSRGTAPTPTEEKAIAYVLSKIKPTDTELTPIIINAKDFCSICGYNERYYYSNAKYILDGLLACHVWINENGKYVGRPYFGEVTFVPGSPLFTFRINPFLKPWFMQLKGGFFQFTLIYILAMKTASGIRLYKLLKSLYFKSRETIPAKITLTVESLKEYLDCVDQYDRFRDFRRRVIDPALLDINTYSDLEVKLETVRSGRSITTLVFHTVDLTKEDMPEDRAILAERIENVYKKIDPNQLVIDGIFDGIGDYP